MSSLADKMVIHSLIYKARAELADIADGHASEILKEREADGTAPAIAELAKATELAARRATTLLTVIMWLAEQLGDD